MFKIKDWYKLTLQTSETKKSFCITKKLIDKTKSAENVPNIEVVEVILILGNYQQTSEVLYTVTPNKSYKSLTSLMKLS